MGCRFEGHKVVAARVKKGGCGIEILQRMGLKPASVRNQGLDLYRSLSAKSTRIGARGKFERIGVYMSYDEGVGG